MQNETKTDITYQKPKLVTKLDENKFHWTENEVATVDEIQRVAKEAQDKKVSNDYYDGTKNLKYYSVLCSKLNENPKVCVEQEFCGWCYSSNSCIHGNENGPADSCLDRHFIHKGKQV